MLMLSTLLTFSSYYLKAEDKTCYSNR